MALDYTTKSGDTWDLIALNVYGSELKADWLMQNNPEKSGDLPPWKAGA